MPAMPDAFAVTRLYQLPETAYRCLHDLARYLAWLHLHESQLTADLSPDAPLLGLPAPRALLPGCDMPAAYRAFVAAVLAHLAPEVVSAQATPRDKRKAAQRWLTQTALEQLQALREVCLCYPHLTWTWLPETMRQGVYQRHLRALVDALLMDVAAPSAAHPDQDKSMTLAACLARLAPRCTLKITAGHLPRVQQAVARRSRAVARFWLTVVLPALGLATVTISEDDVQIRVPAAEQRWLQLALEQRAAMVAPPTDAAAAFVIAFAETIYPPIAAAPPLHGRLHVPHDTAGGDQGNAPQPPCILSVPWMAHPMITYQISLWCAAPGTPAAPGDDRPSATHYPFTQESMARAVALGFAPDDVIFRLARWSQGHIARPVLEQLLAWQRDLEQVPCMPGYSLRFPPVCLKALLRRPAFARRVQRCAARDTVWVSQPESAALFRYLRRRGYTLHQDTGAATASGESGALPALVTTALPTTALWVLGQTYRQLQARLPGLADLAPDRLLRDLEMAMTPEQKTGAQHLLASQQALLALLLAEDDGDSTATGAATGTPWDATVGDAASADQVPVTAAAPPSAEAARPVDATKALQSAINAGKPLTITYIDAYARTTQRRVHPLRLETLHGRQILVAHCELRGEERHFRLDRILAWHVED